MPRLPAAVRRLLPVAAALAGTVAALLAAGTPPDALARFAAYWGVLLVLPGLMVWRGVRARAGPLGEDLAAGAVTGLALEGIAHVAATAAGVPQAFLLAPAGVVVAGAAVPRWRARWLRPGPAGPAGFLGGSLAARWVLAAVVVVAVVAVTSGLGRVPYADGYPLAQYLDLPYQLALAAEAKQHFPMTTPYVAGTPLAYQWAVYEHLAAASRGSVVELSEVTYRLFAFPLLAASVVLVTALAHRVGARVWAGPGAAAFAVLALAASPYAWAPAVVTGWNLVGTALASPTQTYASAMLLGAAVLLADLLREPRPARAWGLLGVLLVACGAGKGTFLPMLGCGLLLAAVVALVLLRPVRPVLVALGTVAACWLVVTLAVLRGQSLGLAVAPLHLLRLGPVAGAFRSAGAAPPPGAGAADLVLVLLGWGGPLAAALTVLGVVLLRGRREVHPVLPVLAGFVVAGVAAALLTGQASYSEAYFVRAAGPVAAVLVVAALDLAAERLRPAALVTGGAVLAGLVLWPLARGVSALVTGATRADARAAAAGPAGLGGLGGLGPGLLVPYAVVLAGVVLIVLGARRFRTGGRRTFPGVVALAVVAVFAAGACVNELTTIPSHVVSTVAPVEKVPGRYTVITADELRAARWLRAHSAPGDLVATDRHCRRTARLGDRAVPRAGGPACDVREFWLAGVSERRVLLEGWAYVPASRAYAAAHGTGEARTPCPYPDRLRDNDAAFETGRRAAVDRLRDRYGVRWLLVTRKERPRAQAALERNAVRRATFGAAIVYELPS